MKKYNKKIIYVIFAMLVLLTACGKAEEDKKVIAKKEDVVKEQETEKPVEPSNTTQTSQEMPQEEKDEPTTQAAQKPTSQISQKPTTGTTSQKPQTPSSETPAKTPIKRVREEEKTGVTPYKHGITKYEIHLKEYMLYSDGSKELLNVSTSTYYDATNYCATDSQLKEEADANATKYMNYYQEVLRLVNEIRAQAGVSPLTLDTTLCKAASMRALEMDYNNELSHTRPSGKDCFSVLDFYNVSGSAFAENIAAGYVSPAKVVDGWKKSPGHYQNMINSSFTKMGVGYSFSGVGTYGYYWCQLFSN